MKITQKIAIFGGLHNPFKKLPWAFKKSPVGKKSANLVTLLRDNNTPGPIL
jgi:hypothetical protein